MAWDKMQIKQHKKAAAALHKIIKKIIEFIKRDSNITDVKIRQFIKEQYKIYNLKSDKQKSIVAFGDDTSFVHYYAEQPRKLKNNNLIMVDIWARLDKKGAPFADITLMMYYGEKMSQQHVNAFKIVVGAKNKAIEYLKKKLKNKIIPTGKEIDAVVRKYLGKHGCCNNFLHGAGHSLGFTGPHGVKIKINKKGKQKLPLNVGYTIEPGIYFKNKFGMRSEIDFYINKKYKLTITTENQKKIIKIII